MKIDESAVAEKINEILGQHLKSGKAVQVIGEEGRYNFHQAIARGGEVSITYAKKATDVVKKGSFGAEIGLVEAKSLLAALSRNKTTWRCTDQDGEPLQIYIK